MNRRRSGLTFLYGAVPRARGDEPATLRDRRELSGRSPRPRG